MVAFKLTMNSTEVNRIGRAAATKIVTDTTRRVLNRAIVNTPVDTGRLRAGNQMRVSQQGNRTVGEVFNSTSYALPVHNGSAAHTIYPKRKKLLRFEVNGQFVYAKKVRIPAQKGRPWLYRALVEVAGAEGYKITRL